VTLPPPSHTHGATPTYRVCCVEDLLARQPAQGTENVANVIGQHVLIRDGLVRSVSAAAAHAGFETTIALQSKFCQISVGIARHVGTFQARFGHDAVQHSEVVAQSL
jgi:hypothetical protein